MHLARTVGMQFNSMDPSPFLDADMDDDASEYLITATNEVPYDSPIKIVVYCADLDVTGVLRWGGREGIGRARHVHVNGACVASVRPQRKTSA